METFWNIKDFWQEHKVSLLLNIFLLIFILISNFCVYFVLEAKIDNSKEEIPLMVMDQSSEETVDEVVFYQVDIKGLVQNPGVYRLVSTSRIIDVIEQAGGLLDNADVSVNNLSKLIADEMVIVIYSKEEVAEFKQTLEQEEILEEKCVVYQETIINESCKDNIEGETETTSERDQKLSINEATLAELIELPGIGEAKAKSIISYREEFGPFKNIEELMNISGIGESVFDKIKDFITTE